MCGLCGFLYKDAGRHGPVGRAMFDMLTPLGRRGTASTGVALYGEPRDDSYVLRVRMERNGDTPDLIHDALAAAGTVTEESHTGGNLRARLGYDGDLGELTDRVEQVPDTEVFSIGRSMEIVKDVGDAAAVERAAPYAGFEGSHAIGHTRMATGSLVDVAHSHPFWARPFADISVVHNGHITNYHKLRRRLAEKGHRFATGNDSEAIAVYIADFDGAPAACAWVRFPRASAFASLWGGSTVPELRHRGLYTDLVAARLLEARARGFRYLTCDARSTSRPILEKRGFRLLTFATACTMSAPAAAGG